MDVRTENLTSVPYTIILPADFYLLNDIAEDSNTPETHSSIHIRKVSMSNSFESFITMYCHTKE